MDTQRAADFHEFRGQTSKSAPKRRSASPLKVRDRLHATYVLGIVLVSTAYVFVTDEEVRNDLMSMFKG